MLYMRALVRMCPECPARFSDARIAPRVRIFARPCAVCTRPPPRAPQPHRAHAPQRPVLRNSRAARNLRNTK